MEISRALQYTNLNMMLACVEWDGKDETYKDTLKALHQETRKRKFGLLVKYDNFFEPFQRKNISEINGMEKVFGADGLPLKKAKLKWDGKLYSAKT